MELAVTSLGKNGAPLFFYYFGEYGFSYGLYENILLSVRSGDLLALDHGEEDVAGRIWLAWAKRPRGGLFVRKTEIREKVTLLG